MVNLRLRASAVDYCVNNNYGPDSSVQYIFGNLRSDGKLSCLLGFFEAVLEWKLIYLG